MTNYNLNGKVIAITGSTGGLGRAAALALTAKGARLALLDLNQDAVNAQAQAFGDKSQAAGWTADVRSMESIEHALAQAATHFGGIDIVIANAGVGTNSSLSAMDPKEFDRTIDINLNGVMRTFRAALPHVAQRNGYLLAISSMAAFVHSPLNTHYAASKAGVWAMCNSLRLEVKHLGVGVGSFHPTFFKTPMMDALVDNPCSMLVWNNHQGIWKFAELEEVVGSLIYTLENRRDMVTVPRQNAFIAGASGFLRPFIEKIGFDRKRVMKAVQLSEATAAKIKG